MYGPPIELTSLGDVLMYAGLALLGLSGLASVVTAAPRRTVVLHTEE